MRRARKRNLQNHGSEPQCGRGVEIAHELRTGADVAVADAQREVERAVEGFGRWLRDRPKPSMLVLRA